MDPASKREISGFLKVLGQKSEENDERTRDLADSLIRAYEFRTFHDVIDDIRQAGEDPEKLKEMLGRLHDWKVLESRAILEIVRGRLSIINKFEQMIVQMCLKLLPQGHMTTSMTYLRSIHGCSIQSGKFLRKKRPSANSCGNGVSMTALKT